jgi:hypothetical protein
MMQYLRKSIKPIMLIIVILFVASCFFMYGTGRSGNAASQPTDEGGNPIADRVVAVVDGEDILLSRLELEVAQFIRSMQLESSATSADFPAFRNTVIDQMATLKELDKEIASRNITVSAEETDAAIAEIESQFPTREIYMQQLQMAGITEAELRQSVEENTKRSKVMDDVIGPVSTDETELRNFYDMMKAYAFQKPEGFMMDVAHFATEAAAETARGKLASGENWDEVMSAASSDVLDSSASDRRMFIPSENLIDEAEFMKELSMDVPSHVVSFTSDDHMIVVKRTKEEAGTATFDEVSADIEQMLVNQKRTSLQSKFMQELRARASVEILDEDLFKTLSPDVAEEAVVPDVTVQSGDEAASADLPPASGN